MTLSEEQVIKLLENVAVLVKDMDSVLARLKEQDAILADLRASKEQGKGVLWVLIGLGSVASAVAGFLAANAKTLLTWMAR
jgi:hypothetical protein